MNPRADGREPSGPTVAVGRISTSVRDTLRTTMELAGWRDAIPAGGTVAVKVNLGWDLFIPGSITSPQVTEALIEILSERAGRIYVVESDQVLEDVETAFRESGMEDVCRRTGATWLNMSRADTVRVATPGNRVLRDLEVPRILLASTLVTVPVMKTHAKTVITGALKNQWGCIDKMRHEYHLVLDDALADLNSIVRPALSVMDGTIALEGAGPKSGQPRVMDLVLCSTDPVALDTIQAVAMGIDPESVAHLKTCAARGIGTTAVSEIRVCGDWPLEPQRPFRQPTHNLVSRIENLLRTSWSKRLFFNTPLFQLMLVGAKLYYRAWDARLGKPCWATACSHPIYGPTWTHAAALRAARHSR